MSSTCGTCSKSEQTVHSVDESELWWVSRSVTVALALVEYGSSLVSCQDDTAKSQQMSEGLGKHSA